MKTQNVHTDIATNTAQLFEARSRWIALAGLGLLSAEKVSVCYQATLEPLRQTRLTTQEKTPQLRTRTLHSPNCNAAMGARDRHCGRDGHLLRELKATSKCREERLHYKQLLP